MKIKELFGDSRIIGYAGNRNTGKTNNLIALILDFRKYNKDTPIYVFGLDKFTYDFIKKLGKIFVINSLDQLVDKQNSLIIIDEFQKLRLSDRRYRELINDFVSLIYHPENNNRLILCSPDLREFNSIIGSKIEKWVVKSIRFSDLVNGSPLKNAVRNYQGSYKRLNDIIVPFGELLVLNPDREIVIKIDYIPEVDTKKMNKDIFSVSKKKSQISQNRGNFCKRI